MKLSKKFLKEYLNIDEPFKNIAEDMTRIGNEYEKVYPLVDSSLLVIGEILEVKDHPDSDHLHVCMVNTGKEKLQIVCGAPNVRVGLKTIVAVSGTKLPGGMINKSVIRGIESNGMMVALNELGIENKYLSEKDILGIHEFDDDAPIGEDAIKYMELDDEVIDFELTANRGDLLSILGLAYEVGTLYSKDIKPIDLSYTETGEDINNSFKISVKTDKCFTFLSRKVLNIEIKESPKFIKNRLIASGIRPINNIVDISNYVMLETGQPMHFYDADKVEGEIGVRFAKEGELLKTLDEKERVLSATDLIIVNKNDEAIGLAGVMGGYNTEIENTTKNIVIESAIFDSFSVRYTSKKILRSESSNRFEKGLDVNRCYMAMDRACNLLEKYASGTVNTGLCEYNTLSKENKTIEIKVSFINKILGFEIPKEEIISIFNRLKFEVTSEGENLIVSVPSRRIDIEIKEDLVEEVGRIYGVEKVKGKLPDTDSKPGYADTYLRDIKHKLASLGLNETLTYTLVNQNESKAYTNEEFESIKILDPMTEERMYLRYSLIPSLYSVYEYNKSRNNKNISIFEIGKSFKKETEECKETYKLSALMTGKYYEDISKNNNVDFYVVKGVIEELLDYHGYNGRYSFVEDYSLKELHPYQSAKIMVNGITVGYIGKLHPNITKEDVYVFEINLEVLRNINSGKIKYKELSKYPSVEKDVSFITEDNINSLDIETAIKKASSNILKEVKVVDVYKEENKYSITYKMIFESFDRTLTDEEVLSEFNKIIDTVCKKFNIKIKNM